MNFLSKTGGRDKLLMLLTFVVISVSSLAWVHSDRTPPPWDPSDHLRFAYDYYQPLAHFDLKGFYREFFLAEHFYAPLVHLITAGFFLIFGPTPSSGILVNILSLGVLMAAVYWIGNHLFARRTPRNAREIADIDIATVSESDGKYPDRTKPGARGRKGLLFSAGALAAVLSACYHFPAWLMHDAFLDFPLIAAVAATFALLIRADDFKNRRYAVHFGIAAGLGLLVKETFPFFFLLPALYVTARVLFSRDLRSIANLVLAALAAAAIASIWYGPHLGDVAKIYHINKQAAVEENEAPLFSFMSNVVYLHGLVSYQIQALFAGLFGVGLLYSMVRRARESVMLYLWILSGIGAFTMLANKDMRYTIPILPAVALLSVAWVNDWVNDWTNDWASDFTNGSPRSFARKVTAALLDKREWLTSSWLTESRLNSIGAKLSIATKVSGYAITTLVIGFSLVSFINAQWPRAGEGQYIDTPHFRWMIFARNYFQFDHHPMPDDWSVPEIAQTIERVSEQKAPPNMLAANDKRAPAFASTSPAVEPPTVGVFVNLPYLNPSSIALYGRFHPRRRGDPAPYRMEWLVEDDRRPLIPKCQYFVIRTGLDHVDWVAPLERYAEKLINDHPEKYIQVARFPIPGSESQAILYRVER